MKYTGPKAKRCRKQGVNLFVSDKYDKILQRKPYGPGKNPRTRQGRKSEYALQLSEKQKARDIYGLSEKQFSNLYKEAVSMPGQTGEIMKQLLERRFDNAIYRAGFAMNRQQARQFTNHGLFLINEVRVTCPSYRLKEKDVIQVRSRSKNSPVFGPILTAHEKIMPPGWLKVDPGQLKADVISLPKAEDSEQSLDMRQIIEFYSRN